MTHLRRPVNFPSLPTDNLYKFLAVAGLVLTGYSAFYAYNQYIELELQILRNATEVKILRIEQKQVLDRVNRMKAKKDRGELTEEEFEQVVRDTKDSLIQGERVLGKANETALLYRHFGDYFYFLYAGLYGGLIMIFLGFVMWYFKIQRPIDAIMKKRASEQQQPKWEERIKGLSKRLPSRAPPSPRINRTKKG